MQVLHQYFALFFDEHVLGSKGDQERFLCSGDVIERRVQVGQIQLRHAVAGVILDDLEQSGQRSVVLSSCPQHLRPLQLELGDVWKLQDGFFQPVVDGFVIAE